jgi:hypothetical protein
MVSPQVIVETVFLTNAGFLKIYAKTSIGFMLVHYLNSEVFAANYMQ